MTKNVSIAISFYSFFVVSITSLSALEEPVISKQARVKEEVTIGKEARERTEQVRETVRNTDVEIERALYS